MSIQYYTTLINSKVYHIISTKKRVVSQFWRAPDDYTECGLKFWAYQQCNYRPKGKHLCKNCKRIHAKKEAHK